MKREVSRCIPFTFEGGMILVVSWRKKSSRRVLENDIVGGQDDRRRKRQRNGRERKGKITISFYASILAAAVGPKMILSMGYR